MSVRLCRIQVEMFPWTNRAGHFGQWLSRKEKRTDMSIARQLGVLGVEVILAGSP